MVKHRVGSSAHSSCHNDLQPGSLYAVCASCSKSLPWYSKPGGVSNALEAVSLHANVRWRAGAAQVRGADWLLHDKTRQACWAIDT